MYEKLSSKCKERGVTVNEFLKECIDLRFDNSKANENLKDVQEELDTKDLAKALGIKMD